MQPKIENWSPSVLSFCFCLMSSDAKSILGTILLRSWTCYYSSLPSVEPETLAFGAPIEGR